MITLQQARLLSHRFQIDEFTIMREYLQLLFLTHLYKDKKGDGVFFKGGTAIRLLLGSSRFSEDLDFSTSYKEEQIESIIKGIKKSLQQELNNVQISLIYSGKTGSRYRLKHQLDDFKFPLVMRLDFSERSKPKHPTISPLVTEFPIVNFPLINHLSAEEILAEKIRAFLTRFKGRDFFDLWFLLKKGIVLNQKLVNQKLKEINLDLIFDKTTLEERIKAYPLAKISLDLGQFLPKNQKKIIPLLKTELLQAISRINSSSKI